MLELWSDLAPLILMSAALPLQTVVALVLVQSSVRSARAWVAGMVTVRLLQGVVFGVVVAPVETASKPGTSYFVGALMLVLALGLYVNALRAMFGVADEDAPPPQWVAKVGAMSPLAAFGAGAGFMTISMKFLVFSLGAIGAIAEARPGLELSVLSFILFVLLGQSLPIAIVALASSSSERAAAALKGFSEWLRRSDRMLNIVFGVIFGTWFLMKAGARLGVL